jgi:hypothetical protein
MYLRTKDYDRYIQDANLQQIISGDDSIRQLAESAAQEEVASYLRPKYDLGAELTDTLDYDVNATYTFSQRVQIPAYPAYNADTSYTNNDCISDGATAQLCINPTTGAFNPTDWSVIGKVGDLYFAKLPYPAFDYRNGVYAVGDNIAYKGRVYECKIGSRSISHGDAMAALYYANLPATNIFPDDPKLGAQYWGTGTAYTFFGELPANTDYWTKGDNRSQQLVQTIIDIALYHIHSRIAPRNIPELRILRYQAAVEWLTKCNSGDISPNLPILPIQKANRIRWGGTTRTQNTY